MVQKIIKYPDPILRKRCRSVDKISKEVVDLVDDMIETIKTEDGLGLAANQVGKDFQIFVLNITPHEDTPTPLVFIDPEILNQDGAVIEEEGCLSFPELYLKITRYETVRLHAKNLHNEDIIYESSGLLARAVQHEIDHLNGIVFIDRAEKDDEKVVQEYLKVNEIKAGCK
ncbi:MAG: peptide deformylase [bacterium]